MNARISGRVRKRRWRDKAGEWHETGWEYILELGKAGGKRRQETKGGFRTRKLATAALRDELRKRESGVYVPASDLTLSQHLEGYEDHRGKVHDGWLAWILKRPKCPIRETTHAVYSDAARLYILPELGDTPIQELTPASIDALYVSLAKGDQENGRRPIGQHSLHNVHTVLHGSLEQAVRWELLERNPAAAASAPERVPPRGAALDDRPARRVPRPRGPRMRRRRARGEAHAQERHELHVPPSPGARSDAARLLVPASAHGDEARRGVRAPVARTGAQARVSDDRPRTHHEGWASTRDRTEDTAWAPHAQARPTDTRGVGGVAKGAGAPA